MRWEENQQKYTVLGIYPSIDKTGLVFLEKIHADIQPRVRFATTIVTKKVCDDIPQDDFRRYNEIWEILDTMDYAYKPHAVGVENCRFYEGQGTKSKKTSVIFGGILFWCFTQGIFVKTFKPGEYRDRFKQLAPTLEMQVEGIMNTLNSMDDKYQGVIMKATFQALLMLDELEKIKTKTIG